MQIIVVKKINDIKNKKDEKEKSQKNIPECSRTRILKRIQSPDAAQDQHQQSQNADSAQIVTKSHDEGPNRDLIVWRLIAEIKNKAHQGYYSQKQQYNIQYPKQEAWDSNHGGSFQNCANLFLRGCAR